MKRNASQHAAGDGKRDNPESKKTFTKGLAAVAYSVGQLAERTLGGGKPTMDPVEMLKEDHAEVKRLFEQFEEAEEDQAKEQIVKTALQDLEIHTALEEEIVYPAVRDLDDDQEHQIKMDEALEEHNAAKRLIEELQSMNSGDERYDAKFLVLAEMVRHHIREEESEILPKAKEHPDLEGLGRQIAERKQELMEEGVQSDSQTEVARRPARKARRKAQPRSQRAGERTSKTRSRAARASAGGKRGRR